MRAARGPTLDSLAACVLLEAYLAARAVSGRERYRRYGARAPARAAARTLLWLVLILVMAGRRGPGAGRQRLRRGRRAAPGAGLDGPGPEAARSARACAARTSRRSSTRRPRSRASATCALTAPGARGRALARADRPDLARGLPVPGHLRDRRRHHGPGAGRRAGRGLPGQHRRDRLRLRALAQPHALRRAHHRLDDRARGGRGARAADRGRGDLQPSARPGCGSTSTRPCSTRSANGSPS